MDDSQKRSLLIISIVAGAALLGWYVFFPPKPQQPTPHAPVANAGHGGPTPSGPTPHGPTPGALGAPPELTEAQRQERLDTQRTATIDTPQFRATFTNLNAALVHYELKGERFTRTVTGRDGVKHVLPMDLVSTTQERYFPLRLDLGGVSIPEDAVWNVEQLSPTSVRFSWTGDGFSVVRKLEAGTGPFQLWSTLRVTNTSAGTRPVRASLYSYHYVARTEEGTNFLSSRSPAISQGICVGEAGTKRFARKDLLTRHTYHRAAYSGTENTYFASLLATHGDPAEFCTLVSMEKGRDGSGEALGSLFEARLAYPRQQLAAGASTVVRTLAYVGPKDGVLLSRAGHQLVSSVDLGFFSIIARAMVKLLGFVHGFVGNWGLAIILMTVCVKAVLFPLTLAQLRSMAKMRALKPQLDKLTEQYGDDKEKKGAATMELYRRNGVNPVAGCLPTMAQLPVWWALYTSLSTNIALFHMPFAFWLKDLSSPDPYFIMPLMLGVLMWVQQRMTPTTMDPAQAKIMQWMMPIMITAFMLFLPQGLTLYMFTNSALGIAQQRYIEYRLVKATAAAGAAAVANADVAPPEAAGASGFKAGDAGKKPGKPGSARRIGRG